MEDFILPEQHDEHKEEKGSTGHVQTERIIKAKITKSEGLEFESTEQLQEGERFINNEFIRKLGHTVHEDLVKSFQKLAIHLLILTESIDPERWHIDELEEMYADKLQKVKVTSFSIGGEDEHEGITIVAQKKLKSGKVFNMVAPFTKWHDEAMPYEFEYELEMAHAAAESEVFEYLGGKHAPNKQLELELTSSTQDEPF